MTIPRAISALKLTTVGIAIAIIVACHPYVSRSYAQLDLTLTTPMEEDDLLRVLDSMSTDAGYTYYQGVGPNRDRSIVYQAGSKISHTWHKLPPDEYSPENYAIEYAWDPKDIEITNVQIRFYLREYKGTFEEREWVMFFEWQDRLQNRFDNSTLSITKHPAVDTKASDLERITEQTGFEKPTEPS